MFNRKRKFYQTLSDEKLLTEYRSRADKNILGELYVRYGHLVMGTCMKYLKNQMDAEDITMILFEKLPSKILNHEINYFKSWLYMVTKNECLMFLRKKGIASVEITRELEAEEDEQSLAQAREVQLSLLEEAIDTLKDEQQKCIRLFYIDRKSYHEITSILDMDLKKVKSAIQNGKRNLKIKLEGKNEFKSIT